MSSLYQLYKHKDKNGTGTVVNKTYTVPLSELYVEPGLNIREIDQDHVAEFRDAFIAGESVPPLDVQVTEKGVKVIDGHHRYYGAIEATKAGADIIRLECKDFVGSEADRIA
ncbi:DNA-binding protein, partial [Klebsiella pneumoniae]